MLAEKPKDTEQYTATQRSGFAQATLDSIKHACPSYSPPPGVVEAKKAKGYSYDAMEKIDITYLLANGGELSQEIDCMTGSVMSEHHVPPMTISYKTQHLGEEIQQVSPKLFAKMEKEDWKYVKWSDRPVQSIASAWKTTSSRWPPRSPRRSSRPRRRNRWDPEPPSGRLETWGCRARERGRTPPDKGDD